MLYLFQSITLRELIKLLPFVSIISLPEVERWWTQRVNNTMDEIWKPVVGYEERYEVSNLGNVRLVISKKLLKQGIVGGYKQVVLSGKIANGKRMYVQRLVAQAFIPNLENKPFVNHMDCIKTNNHFSNLEWVTARENMIHASRNGILTGRNVAKGEQCYLTKLNPKKVKQIRKLSKTKTNKELSNMFGVHVVTIGTILNNLTWKHVK